jgi:hypothetical protein
VKEGSPVDPATLACIVRALGEPLTLQSPAGLPFPIFEDDIPMILPVGG